MQTNASKLFGNQMFTEEEKAQIRSLLEAKMNPNSLSVRKGAGSGIFWLIFLHI
jgi:hypothetical protein